MPSAIFCVNKRRLVLMIFGIAVLVAGFGLIQAPKAEAAAIKYKHIRVKTDSCSGTLCGNKGLYNFFGTNNGLFDEFEIPDTTTNYVQPIVGTSFPDYACGLLLTEEWTLPSDDDYIVWAKKGTILGKNGSLSADVTDYKSCCSTVAASGLPSCYIGAGGSCVADVLTNANKVFKLSYGTLTDNGCNENIIAPCANTPNSCCELSPNILGKVYQFKNQVLCADDGKWTYCDDESACETVGATKYACNANAWENCTALGKTCSASGACVAAGVCVPDACNNNCPAFCGPADDPDCAGLGCSGPYKKFNRPIVDIFNDITKFLLSIIGGIALLVIIIAGVYYITSSGSSERQEKAKKIIVYCLFGVIITLISYGILVIIERVAT